MPKKNAVRMSVMVFPWNGEQIEVMARVDNFRVVGEAYFKSLDLIAEIEDGAFSHPLTGTRFRLLMPLFANSKDQDSILEVETWKTVGRVRG